MSIDAKIINDITHVIKETLRVLQKHKPQIYFRISTKPHSKQIERELDDTIYELYHIDSKIAKYFTDVYTLEVEEQYKEKVMKLNLIFKDRLRQALQIVEKHADKFVIYKNSWIQVNPKASINTTRRMYLNCDPEHVNIVIHDLIHLMMGAFFSGRKPKIKFKFPNYKIVRMKMLIRADKVVVYYGDDETTHKVLRDWAGMAGRFFHKDTPLFTRVEREGVGFAYEPPPKQREYVVAFTGREKVSFGSFMSLVIARYLYAWSIEHNHTPRGAEIVRVAEEIYKLKLKGKHKFKF